MNETKLAVAITTNDTIHDSIGSIFAIAVCRDKEICTISTYTPTSSSHEEIFAELKAQNIETLLCKNANYQTLTYLEEQNIQAFRISEDITSVAEAIEAKLNHKLPPIVKMFTCGGNCDY